MEKLILTDSNEFTEYYLFDYFYPSPGLCQELNRDIFKTIFKNNTPVYTLQGLFETTINRYFLTDIKIMEHPLLVKNVVDYCKLKSINNVELLIHNDNDRLGAFYKKSLEDSGINTVVNFHSNTVYWRNSLTRSNKTLKKHTKLVCTIAVQFLILSTNYLFKRVNWRGKKLLLWNSFANNREKIDYKFLDKLSKNNDLIVVHPNPYLLKSKNDWNKSIYWLGKYSINPIKFLFFAFSLISFKKKFNKILSGYQPFLGFIPEDWNADVILKTIYFFEYNLLMGNLMEEISIDTELKVSSVFRGGAAAGLIYAGLFKQKYNAKNIHNILVPHGTEINPIDHFSYFFMDYNILPSEKIKDNWNNILADCFPDTLANNRCENLNGGRIDYAYLQEQIKQRKNTTESDDKLRIGIVLTYNSESYQQYFINSILETFTTSLPGTEIEFIVKPRPNLPYTPDEKLANNPNLKIDKKDIYSFLNSIDLVIGTVSVYGVLTMVVTDAILCNIPAIYYYPNKNIPKEDLGYSYHSSMEQYSFSSENDLNGFLQVFHEKKDLLIGITELNDITKEYLVFEGDPYLFLEELIYKN
jgi:hypothetical protein